MAVLNTLTTKLADTNPSKQVDGDSPLLSHQTQQPTLASDFFSL